jgi:periplasmic protein TonB
MSFVQPQRNPARHSAGIGVAILFHILLIWALMNGLAHKVMQVINAPIETKIIEEVKPPPPPPKVIELPPPPKFAPPPPVYAPPPEVQVQVTPPPQATITATTAVAPTEPPPPAALRVEAPPAPAAPKPAAAPVSASVVCSNYNRVMGDAAFPRAATRLGLEEGDALIQFTLGVNGDIKDVKAVRASHQAFAENSIRLVGSFKCTGRGSDVTVQVPFAYKSE